MCQWDENIYKENVHRIKCLIDVLGFLTDDTKSEQTIVKHASVHYTTVK